VPTRADAYHHGNLRPALIAAAVEVITEVGPAAMSLRAVARRAGVTHAAASYHFGDKAGLLTAVAADGYQRLADELRHATGAASGAGEMANGPGLEMGVAYVRFAVTHPAHFEVMYRPELYRPEDPELRTAKATTATMLYGSADPDEMQLARGVAAWSIVHGLATLWLNGDLPDQLGTDIEDITRRVAVYLRSRPASARSGAPARQRRI
jgi:AcrR family transcriptional regulator